MLPKVVGLPAGSAVVGSSVVGEGVGIVVGDGVGAWVGGQVSIRSFAMQTCVPSFLGALKYPVFAYGS